MSFSVLTLNLHKGFSPLRRKLILDRLREAIRSEKSDIILLQEVVGKNNNHAARYEDWPDSSQFEYLADEIWSDYAYAKNAVYSEGHHGNAILSRFPIVESTHKIISAHHLEQRGFLHAQIQVTEEIVLHVICVHFGLLESWRKSQLNHLREHMIEYVKPGEPVIIAGDFNDWRETLHMEIDSQLQLREAYYSLYRMLPRTFPAIYPILSIDRIYFSSLKVLTSSVGERSRWRLLSDHLPLMAQFELSATCSAC